MTTAPPLKLERILAPIDFSGVARQAMDYAVPLAARFAAKITLIHVVELAYVPPEPTLGYYPMDPEPLMKAARDQLQMLARDMIPSKLLDATILRTGSPWHEITSAAKDLEADMIVITTHGRTGLSHVVMGSTAERIVRHAHCPVLTVRRQ